MNYSIKGNFNYHLEISQSQLNETTNITINAFQSKINLIPIGCKFQWFKKSDTERIKIESQGNIYQCSIFDIGYKIEVNIQSFETGYDGIATIEFQKIQISSQLETKLSQLYHNNMKQQIYANEQNWIFNLEYLENSTNQQKIFYADQIILPCQNQLQLQFNNQILKFKSKEDKDAFSAFFISMQSLKRVHIKFIAYNIGKINQKQVNFQALLNAQLLQLINEKSSLPIKKQEPLITSISMATSQDYRITQQNQIQITQLKQEINVLQNDKQKMTQQIDKLIKENKELENNLKSSSASKDQLDSLDRLIQSLKNELFSLKQRENDLMNQNARLSQALNEKKDKSLSESQFMDDLKCQKFQEMLQEANFEKQKLQDEINRLQKFGQLSRISNNNDSEKEKEKLIQTNQKLMQEIANQTNKIKELQVELEMMKNMSRISMSMSMMEDPVLKTKVEQLESENQYLLKKISILEEELSKKKQQKPQKTQPEKDIQIQKLTEANKRYLDENIKLFEEIRQLREKMDFSSVLNNSMKESKLNESVVNQQLEQQIERMQQIHGLEISKMKKKIEKLTSELTDASQIKKQFDQLLKQNKRLVEENAHLAEQVQNLADINSSKSFTDTMLNSKIYHSDQYKELEEQLNLQKKKSQDLQQRLDFQLQRDQQQIEKIKQLEIELTKYKNQVRDYQYDESQNNELKLLQNQIDVYQKAKDNLMRENIDLTQQISIQQQDKEFLNQKIKQQENQLYELKNKFMLQQEEIRTLKLFPQSAEKQFNVQLQQLQQQNKHLTEEILRLQTQNNGMKDLSQSNISLSESFAGSKIYEAKEYKILENQKEILQSENQNLKIAIQEEKTRTQEIQILRQEKNKLIEQIKTFEDENKRLNILIQNNNEHYSKQLMILQGEIDKLQIQLRNISRNSSMLIDESFHEKQVIVSGQYQMNERNSLTFNLRSNQVRQEQESQQFTQNIELIQQSQQKDQEIIKLKQELADICRENNRLLQDIDYFKIQIQEFQQRGYTTQNQFEVKLQNKEYESQQQITQLKNQLSDKAYQLKTLQQSYQQNIEEQQQVINQLGQENKNINEVHNSIKTRLESQIQKLVDSLKERDQTINKITEENISLKKQEIRPQLLKQLQDELVQKTLMIEQQIQTNKNLALQVNTLSYELQELKMASVSQSFSKSHIDYRETENLELQNEITQLRQKITFIEQQNEQNTQKYQQKQQQELSLKSKIDEERQDYQREIQFLNQKLTIHQQDLDFYKNEFITTQQTLDKVRQEFQIKNQEKQTSQEIEIISLRELKKELLSQNSELQEIIQTQSNHLNELQEEIQEKMDQIKQLQKTQTTKQYEIDNLIKEKSQISIRFQEQQNNLLLQKEQDIKQFQLQIFEYQSQKKQLEEQFLVQQKNLNEYEKLKQTLETIYKKKDENEIKLHHFEQQMLEQKNTLLKKDKQILELTQTNQYLSKELDNEQDKIELFNKKMNENKNLIQNKDSEIQQLQQKLKLLEDQTNKKDQTINSLNNQISQLNLLKTQQQKQIDQIPLLKQDIEQLTKEKANLQREFELLSDQFAQMEKQIENLSIEKSPMRSKNSSICKSVDQILNEKLIQLELKISQQKQTIEHLEEQIKVEKQQNNGLIQLINKLNEDLREQQEKSYSLDRSSETYLINKSFNSKYHTEQEIFLQNQYQSLDIYDSIGKRQSQYGNYEASIAELTNENKELKQEIEKLQQQLLEQKQHYEIQFEQLQKNNPFQDENKQLNLKLERLQSENQRISQQLQEFKLQDSGKKNSQQNQISQMEEELYRLRSLESSNLRLNNEIRAQITKSIELEQEIDNLAEQNQLLHQQLKQYEEQSNDQKQKINYNKLQEQSNNQNDTMNQLQQENKELQYQLEELKKKYDQVENEMQKTQLKISVKDSQLNQNNRKNKKLEEQIQQLQDELKGKSNVITQDKDELINQLQNQVIDERKESQNIKEQFTKYLEFEQQINTQIVHLESQIDRLTKSNSALLEENCRLNDQLKDVQNQSYISNDSQIQ